MLLRDQTHNHLVKSLGYELLLHHVTEIHDDQLVAVNEAHLPQTWQLFYFIFLLSYKVILQTEFLCFLDNLQLAIWGRCINDGSSSESAILEEPV